MCGRYVSPNEAAIEREFNLGRRNWRFAETRYNVGPTMTVPIVLQSEQELVGESARWGLIPSWWKKEVPPTLTFNARSEEAAEKPMWRQSLKSARCLMPAEGWYEWNEHEQVRTESGRQSNQPYFFHVPGQPVVSIAGMWTVWRAPSGTEVLSCALLTREAEGDITSIHHRMPVVLSRDQYSEWLAPGTSTERIKELVRSSRTDFEAYRVSTKVNSTRNESPDLARKLMLP